MKPSPIARLVRTKNQWSAVLLSFALCATGVWAEPAHPILPIPNITNSTTLANNILNTWTETDYVAKFVPRQAPRRDDAGFADAVVAGDTSWSWSATTPDQITSKPSNKIFPGAAGYTQLTQNVTVLDGSTVAIPYYISAGTTSQKSLVQALIDHKKTEKLRTDLDALADAYMDSGASHAVRNQAYARRIALALYEWGKYVPKYFMTALNDPVLISGGVNYMASANIHRCSARNGFGEELNPRELLAFDAIYDSPALATLSTELGLDVREFIRTNVFGNMGDFFVKHMTPTVASTGTNLPGATQVLAKIARVLNRPDYLPWLDGYFNAVVSNRLNREGTILESLGYSINYIRTVKTGVSDATNYFLTRPADTQELIDAQSHLNGYATFLQQGINAFFPISVPNGQFPAFGDTTDQGFFLASTTPKTSNAGSSGVMGAFGAVSLGAGTGTSSVQLNQMAEGDENHKRSDTAAFVLYAFSNEMIGNIRYFNGSLERQFTEQPIAHNTVTIDRADMSNRSVYTDGSGDITLFEPGNNGLAVTEIDGQRSYSAKASRYQRIMMLNTRDLAKPYVLDVFRVTGGQKHEYSLHGAIMFDQSAECSFPLVLSPRTYPLLSSDAAWDPPVNQYDNFSFYGMFRNVSTAVAPGDFQITYRDTSSPTSHRDLRLWMTDGANATVNVGRSPVPAREHVTPPSFFTNGIWRPSTIISKNVATGTLSSLFVSVIEPMKNGASIVQSVERLPVTGSNLESCAVRVTLIDGRVDTYLVNLRNPEVAGANTGNATVSTADGKYSVTGRIGAVTEGPAGPRVWSIKATDFTYDSSRLSTTDRHYEGTITGETRKATGGTNDAFITTTPLPVGTALRGRQLKLTFGTLSSPATAGISEMFAIDQVVQVGGEYHIVFPVDHRLEITNSGATSIEQQLPKRTFNGVSTFEIDLSASTTPLPDLADISMESNTTSDPIPFSFGDLGTTPAASLQVTAASSNQTLIPNANLFLTGTGNSRSLTLIPAADEAGTSTITVSLTDGKWTSSRSFKLTVTDAGTVTAIASGAIDNTATWSVPLPVGGDALTWRTGAFSLNVPTSQTFYGHTLKIDTGGTLVTSGPGIALALSNLVMNGGSIVVANNNGMNINLGGNKLTLNSGSLKAGSLNNGRDLRFSNGSLSGSGTISIIGIDATGSDVEFQAGFTTKGFTGLFDVKQFGILNLPPISTNSASFGVILSGTGKYVNDANVALTSLTIAGTPIPNGVYTYSSFTPAQQAFFVNTSNSVAITVGPSTNTPPTISDVADLTTDEDTETPALGITIGDAENTTASLTLSGASSNPLLVPNANIVFSGTGANRSVTVTPAANQSGTATITLTVSDGGLTATDTFVLNVNGAPVISAIDDLTIDEDAVIPALDFEIGDDATPVGSLVLSAHSSNELLVPEGNIIFSGSGASRSVAVNPLPNASGIAVITLSVYDGRVATSQSFELTVNSVDDAPTITPIAGQALSVNSATGAINFTVDDVDDPVSSLEISVSSSNTTLVPLDRIILGGSASDRTVVVTPAQWLSGSSTITITVSDGNLDAVRTFVVTVNGFAFLFDQDANFEGWTNNVVVTTTAVSGGALSATIAGNDPQFHRAGLNFAANNAPLVLVRLKSSAGGNAQLFWGNEASAVAGSIVFSVPAGSVFNWYAVNVAANSNWTGHSIKSLRLDPPSNSGTVSIDAITSSDGDLDNDGMDDVWEVVNRLDPSSDSDSLFDLDGDGSTNGSEYILGSNPGVANPASTLALSSSEAGLTLTFVASQATGTGYAGLTRYYDLQTTADLTDGASWSGVPGYTGITGAGQTVTATLPLLPGSHFYRLKVRIAP
jgi:hypothetical protein